MRKRNPRLDNAVAEAIADLLATEFNDPRLRMVSVTEVQVSQDAREAIVFWSVPDRDVLADDAPRGATRDLPLPEDAAAALDSARARLQKLLSNRVRMQNTPVLRFEQDPVRKHADRVEELLRDVRRNRD